MARKGWNSLSANYRARLEKNGISKSEYESGASISGARGHATTPERPSQADPNKHTRYVNERSKLVSRVTSLKQTYFGTSPKWNPLRAAKIFKQNPPSMASLRFWAGLSQDEWLDAIRESPETATYLGYH